MAKQRFENRSVSNFNTCESCSTNNPRGAQACSACGAPFDIVVNEPHVKLAAAVSPRIQRENTQFPKEEIQDAGEKVEEAYFTIIKTYSIAWRTVGEAIAIAVSGFIIGVVGGATGMSPWGVLGALIVGIAVGMTRKNFMVVVLSAPVASILGLFLGGLFWVSGYPQMMVFCVSILAILGAALGGQQRGKFQSMNWWEKARPFLGALGGLGSGLFGMGVGFLITQTIALI
jgi:F0F1-type ATP synthase assembly protein I